MKCWAIPVGMLATNCYIITEDEKECVIVDPGAEAQKILSFLDDHGLSCVGILLTHGHDDHTGALEELQDATGAEVWIGKGDVYRLNKAPDHEVKDGEEIELAGMRFSVVEVPGHTEGSVLFFCGDLMFAGDTLFYRSIGRTDLPGGDLRSMQRSLAKILAFDSDYQVLPGHGPITALSEERERNPFLQ